MKTLRKKEQETDEAALTIEEDALAITTQNGTFRLPKAAVDQLVSSLLISGFGPQTPAQYNTILTFRDLKHQASEQDRLGRHQ